MAGWTARREWPEPDPVPGLDPDPVPGCGSPRTLPTQGCCHAKASEHAEASAAAGRWAWASVAWRKVWPESRVCARSASRRPVASPLVRSGCTPPDRSHRGQGTGRRWTCLPKEVLGEDLKECLNTFIFFSSL